MDADDCPFRILAATDGAARSAQHPAGFMTLERNARSGMLLNDEPIGAGDAQRAAARIDAAVDLPSWRIDFVVGGAARRERRDPMPEILALLGAFASHAATSGMLGGGGRATMRYHMVAPASGDAPLRFAAYRFGPEESAIFNWPNLAALDHPQHGPFGPMPFGRAIGAEVLALAERHPWIDQVRLDLSPLSAHKLASLLRAAGA